MSNPAFDAPITGGFLAGGRVYAYDGDFTSADPCGPPQISYPLPGDSQPSGFPIIILDRTQSPPVYTSVPIGQGFNVQPLTNSQAVMVIEQEFMVATAAYVPMPLNTPYNPVWGTGWEGTFLDLEDCFLVEEGPLVDVGGGISRFKRKFCNLPPNRNEYESYNAQFPALDDGSGNIRFGVNRVVNSRIFYEYFIFDDAGLQTNFPLFPQGHRITSATVSQYGSFILIEDTKFFKGEANAVNTNNLLDVDQPVTDDASDNPPQPTVPSYAQYSGWANFNGTGTNGIGSEIVAEASSFTRWMGNIFARRTRFVLAL